MEHSDTHNETGHPLLHPGWQSLASLEKATDEVFEKFLFMLGFDFSSNIYVITGDYLTIVDAGNDYTAFLELWDLGYQPTDVRKVVLTHGHPDHVMGVFELLRSYPSLARDGHFELILHEAGPVQLKEAVNGFGLRVTEVRGGETLELSGLEWEVIHTPGHTIDGICLYHPDSKTLFTGDTVLPHAMAEIDQFAGGELDHYLYGLRSLLQREVEHVLPGHEWPVFQVGRQVIEQTYEALLMRAIEVESPVPWLEGAKALAERGLYEDALFCCDKELALRPDNLRALELKGLCLNDLGRNQEAIEVFDRILARREDDVFALMGKGCALLELGRYDESLSHLDAVLKLNPELEEALMYKGMALYLSGRLDEAMEIEPFKRAYTQRFGQQSRT